MYLFLPLTVLFSPHFLRVHQHACAVLQHLLHVLSHRAGNMAGVLFEAFLQGKEADRVETSSLLFLVGNTLTVSKHIPTSLD